MFYLKKKKNQKKTFSIFFSYMYSHENKVEVEKKNL